MARPLPVNLLLAGTGAVLLVSGIGGQPIGKVLQGSFGSLKFNPNAKVGEGSGTGTVAATGVGGQSGEVTQTSFSPSTAAPPPPVLSRRMKREKPSHDEELKGIARILNEIYPGVNNPSHMQIEHARELYRIETGQVSP